MPVGLSWSLDPPEYRPCSVGRRLKTAHRPRRPHRHNHTRKAWRRKVVAPEEKPVNFKKQPESHSMPQPANYSYSGAGSRSQRAPTEEMEAILNKLVPQFPAQEVPMREEPNEPQPLFVSQANSHIRPRESLRRYHWKWPA